jgi:hypothetical protein
LGASDWPSTFDVALLIIFLAAVVLLPGLGYCFMVLDYRAYLRSLRRKIARIVGVRNQTPEWALRDAPRCVAAFGLELPCTEAELKAAYRVRIKHLHPDVGGDRRKFLQLKTHYEEALEVVRRTEVDTPSRTVRTW